MAATVHIFPLAPMSPLIRGLTYALLLIPIGFGWGGWMSRQVLLGWLAVGLIGLYAGVWLGCRPATFRVTPHAVVIQFPLWQRTLPRVDILRVDTINAQQFRHRFGAAVRVGVGGLWGGFGWLWTQRQGALEFYISRSTGLVLLERPAGRSLLITPDRPAEFVALFTDSRSKPPPLGGN